MISGIKSVVIIFMLIIARTALCQGEPIALVVGEAIEAGIKEKNSENDQFGTSKLTERKLLSLLIYEDKIISYSGDYVKDSSKKAGTYTITEKSGFLHNGRYYASFNLLNEYGEEERIVVIPTKREVEYQFTHDATSDAFVYLNIIEMQVFKTNDLLKSNIPRL